MAQSKSGSAIEYLNPNTLSRNPAFTQVVVVPAGAKTIYIGGQDAVDASGEVVGIGDIRAQAEQVFRNIQAALEAAGAGLEHVVKWTIYVVHGQPIAAGFEVFQRVWGGRNNPPAITVAFVAALANPNFLVEIDAVAVVA